MTFIFMPGHMGIKGNKRGDSLANRATVVEGRIRIALISSMLLKISVGIYFKASCILHLLELGVMWSVARSESYARSRRRLIN